MKNLPCDRVSPADLAEAGSTVLISRLLVGDDEREISHDLDRLGSGSRFTVRAARDACARVCGVCGSERCGEGAAREVSAACDLEWSERGWRALSRAPDRVAPESGGTSFCARSPRDLVAERSRLS